MRHCFLYFFSLYFNHVTRLPLFDKYVGSVLRYASEVWEIWEFHKGGAFLKNTFGILELNYVKSKKKYFIIYGV